MTNRFWIVLTLIIFTLSGCGSGASKKSGNGYYGGDSAPSKMRDYDRIPDATPRSEPLSKTGNKSYTALGKRYVPMKSAKNFTQTGTASWYGKKFHGRRTSSGEIYDMWGMTAAHPVLPLPTYVKVINLDTQKSIVVKINDRGPFLHNRIIDLSFAAAHKLGIAGSGTGRVKIIAINPNDSIRVSSAASQTVQDTNAQQVSNNTVVPPQGYFIQVGSYTAETNAQNMRLWLKNHGYQLHPESNQQQLSLGAPYRIQVGPFESRNSALQTKSNLEQLLNKPTLLIIK